MTRTLIVFAAFLSLAVPTALAAPPAGKGKPENHGLTGLVDEIRIEHAENERGHGETGEPEGSRIGRDPRCS